MSIAVFGVLLNLSIAFQSILINVDALKLEDYEIALLNVFVV